MFEKLEVRLISLLEDYKSLTLKDCALVLSAYVQNIPIPL
jgi:hypothetical protein